MRERYRESQTEGQRKREMERQGKRDGRGETRPLNTKKSRKNVQRYMIYTACVYRVSHGTPSKVRIKRRTRWMRQTQTPHTHANNELTGATPDGFLQRAKDDSGFLETSQSSRALNANSFLWRLDCKRINTMFPTGHVCGFGGRSSQQPRPCSC